MIRSSIYTNIHKYTQIYINIHINTQIYTYTSQNGGGKYPKMPPGPGPGPAPGPGGIFVYLCYFCICVYICVFMCICMYICVYLCIFTYFVYILLYIIRHLGFIEHAADCEFQEASHKQNIDIFIHCSSIAYVTITL